MENKKLILVPTDFSEVCTNAVNYGANLAALLGHSLMIVHIIDKKTKSQLKKEKQTYTVVIKKLEDLAKKTASKYKIDVNSLAREGDIFTTISEIAVETKANLLIVGTHGKTNLQQKISISYVKRLIVTSPVPVVVVQKGTTFSKEIRNIVFPVSTTAEVRQKVKWAVIIAKAFHSRIHLYKMHLQLEADNVKMEHIVNQITDEFDKNFIAYDIIAAKKSKSYSNQVQEYAYENKSDLISIMISPDPLNFKLNSYDEKMIFNPYEIPVMCVNPVETSTSFWY